jgi:hypothetical protein
MMDEATLPRVDDDITIDLRRTTGQWERPALAKVTTQPLDLSDDVPVKSARPGLLTRTLSVFSR